MGSVANELDIIPVQSSDYTDQQDGVVVGLVAIVTEGVSGEDIVNQVVNGFGNEGRLSFEGAASSSGYSGGGVGGSGSNSGAGKREQTERLIDSAINASIVFAAGIFAITKMLTIDSNYWHVSGYSLVFVLILFIVSV